MTLLAWLGGLLWRNGAGRPTKAVFWMAIIVSGIIFGWAHIDDKISNPEIQASPGAFATVMSVNTVFGVILGLLYWKQGLESAILAHFLIDAFGTGIVVPAYLSNNLFVQTSVFIGLVLVGIVTWRVLLSLRSIDAKFENSV
jgi:membrane protease YdiL (CAAX protease family)